MPSSTKPKRRSAAQLAADGFAALVQELGMAEAMRYVQLYNQGVGDYTRERHKWLDAVSHDQLMNQFASATRKSERARKGKKAKTASR